MARTSSAVSSMAEQVRQSVGNRKRKVREYDPSLLVPTGSTLLNLACSDNPHGGYGLGKIVTLPGSSSAGKTLLMLTTFAESAQLEHLAEHELVYDDVEASLEFDLDYLFGTSVADRITEPPNGSSNTIEDFKANVMGLTKKGKSFIYSLDSFDALTSSEELEKEMRKALAMAKSEEAAKKIAGSYGTEKAKIATQTLRMIKRELQETNSLLIIIQQLRQNINAGLFGQKYITSGGEAPFFYSTHQVWLSRIQALKSKGRKVGSTVKAEVRKNKLTGKERTIEFDVFYDYGVDDIGSCIDFLVKEEFWKKSGHSINAEGLEGLSLRRRDLIEQIEERGLHNQLKELVAEAWKEIEEEIRTDRLPKYE